MESKKLTPDAPYTVAQCKRAMGATNALIVGAPTVGIRKFWERVERHWEKRLAEAEAREKNHEEHTG